MKDITIVIPLYNKVNYVYGCLESVFNSIHETDYECIVVDDGSTDGSTEIAVDFCNNHPDRFTYVRCLRNHKLFPSYARNIGIRMAESKYIQFHDADDWLCEGYIDRGVKFMNENPDCDWYGEAFYDVYKEENGVIEFYNFYPYKGNSELDYKIIVNCGGGIFIRGIFKTDIVKNLKYQERPMEDILFVLDYLYPCRRYHLNLDNFAFYYFDCRSEQDVYAAQLIEESEFQTDREYILDYVKNKYTDFYNAYIKEEK